MNREHTRRRGTPVGNRTARRAMISFDFTASCKSYQQKRFDSHQYLTRTKPKQCPGVDVGYRFCCARLRRPPTLVNESVSRDRLS